MLAGHSQPTTVPKKLTDAEILDWLQEEGVFEIQFNNGIFVAPENGNLREILAERIHEIQREREL